MLSIPTTKTPQIIQLLNWIFRPLEMMEANFRQHGDLFRVQTGRFNRIFACHPDAIKYILTHDNRELSAPGSANQIFRPIMGENSLVMLNGERHRRHRQLIIPRLHGEYLEVFGGVIRSIARDAMTELSPGTSFQARQLLQKISMRVILRVVFGIHQEQRYRQLETLVDKKIKMIAGPVASMLNFFPRLQKDMGRWSPGHKINVINKKIDQILFAEIKQRRDEVDPSRTDILSMLLLAKDDKGAGLNDQELRDELITLLVAGHDTTATAMAWSLYWIHREPEVCEKLLKEIETSYALTNSQTLSKLPYLNAVCNETLRLYPVVITTFPRQVETPLDLMGHELVAGDLIVGCIYLLHHREEIYPNSYKFKPERFLERMYSSFEFIPFGAGARRCVGSTLALYEMKIVVATLLSEFELALTDDKRVIPQRRGVTLAMKGDVNMAYKGPRQP